MPGARGGSSSIPASCPLLGAANTARRPTKPARSSTVMNDSISAVVIGCSSVLRGTSSSACNRQRLTAPASCTALIERAPRSMPMGERFGSRLLIASSLRRSGQVEHRHEHADGDEADKNAQRDQDDRLENAGERSQRHLVLFIEKVRDGVQQRTKLAAALAAAHRLVH